MASGARQAGRKRGGEAATGGAGRAPSSASARATRPARAGRRGGMHRSGVRFAYEWVSWVRKLFNLGSQNDLWGSRFAVADGRARRRGGPAGAGHGVPPREGRERRRNPPLAESTVSTLATTFLLGGSRAICSRSRSSPCSRPPRRRSRSSAPRAARTRARAAALPSVGARRPPTKLHARRASRQRACAGPARAPLAQPRMHARARAVGVGQLVVHRQDGQHGSQTVRSSFSSSRRPRRARAPRFPSRARAPPGQTPASYERWW